MTTETEQRIVLPTLTESILADQLGVSLRALQIAKAIDRLRSGRTYRISLTKDDMDAKEWKVTIARDDTILNLLLPRSRYVPE